MLYIVLISGISAAINLSVALLALVFSRGSGWKIYRLFAGSAFIFGVYALNDTLFLHRAATGPMVDVAATVNVFIAPAGGLLWLMFSKQHLGTPWGILDQIALAVLVPAILVGLIPGVLTDGVVPSEVVSLGLRYHTPNMTLLGIMAASAGALTMLLIVIRYLVASWSGTKGAKLCALGFLLYAVFAVEEMLVALDVLAWPYLLDLGFLGLVVAVAVDMSARVSNDSRALIDLNQDLASRVEERSAELVSMREALLAAERQAALGQLAAGVGHEINNPLAYVSGNLSFLLEQHKQTPWSPDELEAIEDAIDGVERIGKIVRALTARLQVDSNASEDADVGRSVETAIKMARAQVARDVDFDVQAPAGAQVLMVEGELIQVLVNLLVNAVHASETDTSGSQTLIRVRVRVWDEGNEMRVEVSDEGCGIEQELLARVFDPLYTTKGVGKGTGLGLFVCKGLIEAAGGTIQISSERNHGTTVSVRLAKGLPEREAGVVPGLMAQAQAESLPAALRVYLIDDEELVSKALVRMLRPVTPAVESDSRAALDHLSRVDYDVVLCDLMMPNLSGMELYRRVIERKPAMANKFLFITGGAATIDAEEFLRDRRDSYLEKPLRQQQLIDAILRVSQRPSLVATDGERVTPRADRV